MKRKRCKYFNGTKNDECEAGVNYRKLVGGDDFGWGKRTPCFSDHATEVVCPKREFLTSEEEAKEEEEIKERLMGTTKAINQIKEKHKVKSLHDGKMDKKKEGITGTIECPLCKGNLNYSIAPGNHHIWGQCETKDCLSWMM